jgi:hypothetical protein
VNSAGDDALLRDQVLDEVMAEETEKRAERRAAKSAPASAPSARRSKVGVRGITGSLNSFEVEQAMSTQTKALLACVRQRPRALAHVAGDIAFHIDVDGSGKVGRVLVMESDIGYAPLEQCLSEVVAAAPFPVPAGAQRAETQWRMSVDPLQAPAEPIDGAELEETIARHAEQSYESCEIERARQFQINGYLAQGKLHALSVRAPWRGPAHAAQVTPEQLACLSQELESWNGWPRAHGAAKVGFELRWVKAPPPAHARGRARVRRRK